MAEESFIPRAFHPQLQQVFDRFEQGVKVEGSSLKGGGYRDEQGLQN